MYLVYSTGWRKHYNAVIPFVRVESLQEAVNYMREFLQEGRAVKLFCKPVNVDQFKVTTIKNKRVIRRK
jgi:hypothetical protein